MCLSVSQPIKQRFGSRWDVLAAFRVSQTVQEEMVLIRTYRSFGLVLTGGHILGTEEYLSTSGFIYNRRL